MGYVHQVPFSIFFSLLKGEFEEKGQENALCKSPVEMAQRIGNGRKAGWLDIVCGHVNVGWRDSSSKQKEQKGGDLRGLIETSENQQESTPNFGNARPIGMKFLVGQTQLVRTGSGHLKANT